MEILDNVLFIGILTLIPVGALFIFTRTPVFELTTDDRRRIGLRSPWWRVPSGFWATVPGAPWRGRRVVNEGGRMGVAMGPTVLVPHAQLSVEFHPRLGDAAFRQTTLVTVTLTIVRPDSWPAAMAISQLVSALVDATFVDTSRGDQDPVTLEVREERARGPLREVLERLGARLDGFTLTPT